MKKLTAKQYAVSLYETIEEAKGEDLKNKIHNFLKVVKKRKDIKLLNKIFERFVEIYQIRKGIMTAEVTSSHKLSSELINEIKKWLKKETGNEAEIYEKVTPEILGGVVIKYNDTILDASLRNNLNNLKNKLIK